MSLDVQRRGNGARGCQATIGLADWHDTLAAAGKPLPPGIVYRALPGMQGTLTRVTLRQ